MDDETLVDTVRQLVEELRRTAFALQEEPQWSEWFLRCANRLEQKDLGGAEWALKAFGGMGSVNDRMVDRQTQIRLSTIYRLARDVQREAIRRGLL